jgi:hypothetical protein
MESLDSASAAWLTVSTPSVLLLAQEIFVEILGGNKAGSRIFRDKPPFPHQIFPLISARRA